MALICIIALAVFAVMGIFSAKYRAYAKEAFACFINTVRLRKCDTGLDQKIKAEIVGKLLPVSPPVARAVNGHFELITAIFVIISLVSTVYSGISVYNFAVYGNCNGPSGGYCVLNTLTGDAKFGKAAELKFPLTTEGQSFGNANYKLIVYEFGCYSCGFTAQAEPIVEQLYAEYGNRVEFVYKTFPLPDHPYSNEAALASWCAYEQGTSKYMAYRNALFSNQAVWKSGGNESIIALAKSTGLEMGNFTSCFQSAQYQLQIDQFVKEGSDIGIYGTPTFFISNQSFVGAVTYDELKGAIDAGLGAK